MTAAQRTPFAANSVSIGLYSEQLPSVPSVDAMLVQAVAAAEHGFDGVTLAEHHGGFPGYFPDPLLATNWVLGEIEGAWAAAFPVLLPLRSAGLVVESVAWTAARFPGRIGIGFAPGWVEDDFVIAGASFDDRRERYWTALRIASRALQTGAADGPLGRDPAVTACATAPVPVVSAAAGPVGVRRAARAGTGIILADFHTPKRLRELTQAYVDAGGLGPRAVMRRVWLGKPPERAIEQLWESYTRAGGDTSFLQGGSLPDTFICSDSSEEIASHLAELMLESNVTALSLRVHLPDVAPEQTLDQIAQLGETVLPKLRAAFGVVV